MPLLSIVIPTYNRKECLVRCIQAIVPQLIQETELIVLDNCSDTPVSSFLNELDCRIIRNSANIGAVGNVLKCFEVASGQWLWIIGDDDQMRPDGIQQVLSHIKQCPDFSHIFFSNHMGKINDYGYSTDIDGFCKGYTPLSFGGRLWISGQVFNRDHALSILRYAHAYPGSSPQLPIVLMQAATRKILFSPEEIAIHHEPAANDSWNVHSIYSQMTQLALLPVELRLRQHLAVCLAEWFHGYNQHYMEVLKAKHQKCPDADEVALIFKYRWQAIFSLFDDQPQLMNDLQDKYKSFADPDFIDNAIKQLPPGQQVPFNNGDPAGNIR